jgi:hypothetical protein
MKVMTGTVVDGRVEVPAEFAAEGSQVMVLMPTDGGGPVRLSLEEEQELLESLKEIRRGNFIDGKDLLNELRSRQLLRQISNLEAPNDHG